MNNSNNNSNYIENNNIIKCLDNEIRKIISLSIKEFSNINNNNKMIISEIGNILSKIKEFMG